MEMIQDKINKYKDYAIEMRRYFHQNPEPSLKEFATAKKIQEELDSFGIENKIIAQTGVVAWIRGKSEGKTIALRADMDALEITEKSDKPYCSQNQGLMHACGHDAHTASLLGAARILNELKDSFSGTVKLIFQPGEEVAQGAKNMIAEGVLDGVDRIFGIHIWNGLECGKVSVQEGPRMASAGQFEINVKGKGGHGSLPHETVDAVVVGAAIVMNLQSYVSREISPLDAAVLSIGQFHSGTRFNVIPGDAYLEGTTRSLSLEVNKNFEKDLRRIVEFTAKAYRAEVDISYEQKVIPVVNDPEISAIAEKSVAKILGEKGHVEFPPTTGGEDFSYFLETVPGAFAFVGSKRTDGQETYPHHHEKFDVDEEGIGISMGLYAQVALDLL